MRPFTTLTGVAAPLPMANVDTDKIIPARFLKSISRSGFGKNLFYNMRFREDGSENPDFVLNRPPYRNAEILVAHENFGCGSSREHAPWALDQYGFRAIVAAEGYTVNPSCSNAASVTGSNLVASNLMAGIFNPHSSMAPASSSCALLPWPGITAVSPGRIRIMAGGMAGSAWRRGISQRK